MSYAVITDISPSEFFRDKVVEAQERQKIHLSQNVEFYLVNLLCEFLAGGNQNQQQSSDCLALILKQAMESSPGEQVLLFKRLGDTALYFSGFFQEYFNNKLFKISYYVSMGENAYGQLSGLMRGKQQNMVQIYSEMSQQFAKAVDILMDVSESTNHQIHKRDTLSLYDAWLETASEKLERDLRNRGVQPVVVSKKWIQ